MILAGIDIGTNTLRLLVAETGPDSFHEIYADRKITRLGQDLDRSGMLTREAEDRSLKALGDFAERSGVTPRSIPRQSERAPSGTHLMPRHSSKKLKKRPVSISGS